MSKKRASNRVSANDVARLAGVSQSAVSRTFTPGASVSEKTREKVRAAARKLGYRPNVIAKSLVQQATNIIGVMFLELWNPFFSALLGKLTQTLQVRGYQTLLVDISNEQSIENALLTMLQYQADGIISGSEILSWRLVDECARAGTPIVLLNHYSRDQMMNVVCCDDVAGGEMAADVFLHTGRERIAYIAGRENSSASMKREHGFVQWLHTRGAVLYCRESGDFGYASGCAAARRLFQQSPRPDAIFCASDLIAIAVIEVARCEFDLKIPEEVSVIGFDGIPMAAWQQNSLTTIAQPMDLMVEAATDILQAAIQEPDSDAVTRLLPGQLIQRGSTLPVQIESLKRDYISAREK